MTESKHIEYAKYRKPLGRWMAPHVGAANATDFLRLYGTKPGHVGGAMAARNAGVLVDAWQSPMSVIVTLYMTNSRVKL